MTSWNVYTFIGQDRVHDKYFDFTIDEGSKSGNFLIPKDTVLFHLTRSPINRNGESLGNIYNTPKTKRLYNTFHAAILQDGRLDPSKNLSLYVVHTTKDLQLRIKRGRAKPRSTIIDADAIVKAKTFHTILAGSGDLDSLKILYRMALPIADPSPLRGIFNVDSENPEINYYEETAQFASGSAEKDIGSVLENLKDKSTSRSDDRKYFRELIGVLNYDQYDNFRSVDRYTEGSTFNVTRLPAIDIEGDHLRFLELCRATTDVDMKSAALYVQIRAVGHWPNRAVLWIAGKSHATPAGPDRQIVHIHQRGTQLKSYLIGPEKISLGFVAVEIMAVKKSWPRVKMHVMASADTGEGGGINAFRGIVAQVHFALRHAHMANGDLVAGQRANFSHPNGVKYVSLLTGESAHLKKWELGADEDEVYPYKNDPENFPGVPKLFKRFSNKVIDAGTYHYDFARVMIRSKYTSIFEASGGPARMSIKRKVGVYTISDDDDDNKQEDLGKPKKKRKTDRKDEKEKHKKKRTDPSLAQPTIPDPQPGKTRRRITPIPLDDSKEKSRPREFTTEEPPAKKRLIVKPTGPSDANISSTLPRPLPDGKRRVQLIPIDKESPYYKEEFPKGTVFRFPSATSSDATPGTTPTEPIRQVPITRIEAAKKLLTVSELEDFMLNSQGQLLSLNEEENLLADLI